MKCGEVRRLDHLMKAAMREQNQRKRDAEEAVIICSAVEMQSSKTFGVHILPQVAFDAALEIIGFSICLSGF